MNYEKLYKEALERASKYYNANTNKGYREIFEDIFHEFKESEDERIRKGLIKGLSAMRDIHKHQTFSDDAINIDDAIAWLEKQSEQKPADNYCQENCKGYRDTGGKCFADGECKAKIEAGQKSAWSEEDEANMDAVWKACGQVYGTKYQSILGDWLKSLKDRFKLQPKQEWRKDLPKWKKITKREQNYLVYGYLSNDGYYLSIQELKDKLPKEE